MFLLVTAVLYSLLLLIPFANTDLETQNINNLRDKVLVVLQRGADSQSASELLPFDMSSAVLVRHPTHSSSKLSCPVGSHVYFLY